MSAKLTLFPPQGAARSFVFREARNHFAGRDPGSDIYLQDPRVSSRHALFQWTGSAGSWNLVDLRSKNGTFVNGSRITDVPLQDADWMSFGGLLAFFERLSAAQVAEQDGERAARLEAVAAARLALVPNVDPRATLRSLLASAREQLGAERGLLLLLDAGGGLHVGFASGFARYEPLDETFETGLTALRKALETRRPVAALDHHSHSAQGKRRSFTDLGRGAIGLCAAFHPAMAPRAPGSRRAQERRRVHGAGPGDSRSARRPRRGCPRGRPAVRPRPGDRRLADARRRGRGAARPRAARAQDSRLGRSGLSPAATDSHRLR